MTKVKYFTSLLLVILILNSCVKEIKNSDTPVKKADFGLVIHGGAGFIHEGRYTKEQEESYRLKLEEALITGNNILENNGKAIDAVESAIRILEDSPLFNAGKGAVFTEDGNVELDASIMDGSNINAGGVAGIKHIKNPITLARLVMEHSPHVFLFGEGAEKFADEFALEKVSNNYFKTENNIEEYNMNKREKKLSGLNSVNKSKYGTVGCVALDKMGNLAAGTSTGGISGKKFGRVGDSPIIGAGTYANNKTCALSATGQGEYFIRNVVAFNISSLMEYKNISLKDAAEKVINGDLKKQNALGGIIGIDTYGNVVTTFNTEGMFRGFMLNGVEPIIKIYK